MRKTKKFAAVMAVALGVGVTPYANALIEHHPNGRGDALLFPVFYGYGENYFTISNSSSVFIQGHIRFRGAAWSGELLDFDVILTPGDVFVFRLADVDGDGFWEIDQSLDTNNFAYTGMLKDCTPEGGVGVSKKNCMDQYSTLIPLPTAGVAEAGKGGAITPELIDHHRNLGYVEFIGEGILNGMTHPILNRLIDPEFAGQRADEGQRRIGNRLGTHLWSWVLNGDSSAVQNDNFASYSPATPFRDVVNNVGLGLATDTTVRTAADVPNALSGTAFLTQAGQSHGLSYNAEALVNFRTNGFDHRVSNYDVPVNMGRINGISFPVAQTGVILHNESASARPGDFNYVYGYREQGSQWNSTLPPGTTNTQEGRISFNNTWGPTLADGDDYNWPQPEFNNLAQLRWTNCTVPGCLPGEGDDSWDNRWAGPNSIAEVEEAIRAAVPSYPPQVDVNTPPNGSSPRQLFTSFYFDGATFDAACQGNQREDNAGCSSDTLQSWYFAFFPTKFFYGENPGLWLVGPDTAGTNITDGLQGYRGYLQAAVEHLLTWGKPFRAGVWDIFENFPGTTQCVNSPCLFEDQRTLNLREELAVFNIKTIKNLFAGTAHQGWQAGRVSLQVDPAANLCREQNPQGPNCVLTYPGLMYTFDWGSDGYLSHWRPMER
jgi:hypothetical protein